MITLKTEIQEFSHIVHLADIQIRLTKRQEEYREVFSRLFDSVRDTPKSTAICIVGDIVHSKLNLSPECVQLTKEFFVGLADIRPVILVAGNHDTNLINRSRLDSLSPIVEAINHPNLYYLKESGLFGLGDICFNNYSVFDDVTTYIKGSDIPNIYRNKYRYFVCLFHGTIDGAESELGFKLVNKSIPVSLFDHHDVALLGDIHKIQDLQSYEPENHKPYVHYCGSLIQQNHGEDLYGHGYSFWDLKARDYTHIPILNDYGYFTIKINKGTIVSDLSDIPSKSRVRLSCFESLPTETKKALLEIKTKTTLVEPPVYTREETEEQTKKLSSLGVNLIQGDLSNRDQQIKLLIEFAKNKLEIKDQTLIDEIIKVNDEANSLITHNDVAKNIRWSPIKFEWENLFSFGENNVINFTKLKGIYGLFANNASGKSSIFSALSWCIFDKCERDFKSNNIINDQKMSCRALLELDIGGVRYFIERSGKADNKGSVKVNVRFYRIINDKEEDLTGEERSDTNAKIREYMGSYEDFLLTSLSVQKSGKYETSFIDLGDSGRKDLLAQFMGLVIFDKLHEVSNKKLNEIISILRVFKNENYEKELESYSLNLSQSNQNLSVENEKLAVLTQTKEMLQQKIIEETYRIIKLDVNIPLIEESIKNLETAKKSLEVVTKTYDQLLEISQVFTKSLPEIEVKIKEFELKNIVESHNIYKNLLSRADKIDTIRSKVEAEVRFKKEKIEKAKLNKFDPNCKYCVDNNGELAIEAAEAKTSILTDKEEYTKLMNEKNENSFKQKQLESVERDYIEYLALLKKIDHIKNSQLSTFKSIELNKKKMSDLQEIISTQEKNIELYNVNKTNIEFNQSIAINISKIKLDLSNVTSEYNKINAGLQTCIGRISVCKSKIDELQKKLIEVRELEIKYKSYDAYVKSVHRDGIPYEVIAVAVPEIENEVNSILSQIVEFHARFVMDGKNIVPYIVYDERKWLMSLGSGMEQFILSMAIRVALTNLSNLPKPSFLVQDEGFGTLDADHLSTLQSLFNYLKNRFDFVIIISHLETLRDMVDSHIEIKKENGFSRVDFV
jgi:DNA repair exonuclease SbcCD ATPase subunit